MRMKEVPYYDIYTVHYYTRRCTLARPHTLDRLSGQTLPQTRKSSSESLECSRHDTVAHQIQLLQVISEVFLIES
jgi:hypothetical protein